MAEINLRSYDFQVCDGKLVFCDGKCDNCTVDEMIDLVEVVRGKWIPNPQIGWGETWVCSICGEKTTSSLMGEPRYKYCPMCGARMKGDNDEAD